MLDVPLNKDVLDIMNTLHGYLGEAILMTGQSLRSWHVSCRDTLCVPTQSRSAGTPCSGGRLVLPFTSKFHPGNDKRMCISMVAQRCNNIHSKHWYLKVKWRSDSRTWPRPQIQTLELDCKTQTLDFVFHNSIVELKPHNSIAHQEVQLIPQTSELDSTH